MPWPLVFAGLWLATLIAWISVLVYDECRDRQARERITQLSDGEPFDEAAWLQQWGIGA